MNTAVAAPPIVLTEDQQLAMQAFQAFIIDPIETVFVLSGYSGCGKTTLVRNILEELPNFMKMAKLVSPDIKDYSVHLTATTNKAAENMQHLTSEPVGTIHSLLGFRVITDYKTNVTQLMPAKTAGLSGALIFIDEASYIDSALLKLIFIYTKGCKIVFIGDPAQLTPVKSNSTPVFDAKFTGAALTTVVRQAKDNPIIDLSTKFRETVNTGEFFAFTPDGEAVQYLERSDFNAAIDKEFTRPDWKYQDSKIMAWTNKCVIAYNKYVTNMVTGDPEFQKGDYAVCNKFISHGRKAIKTDEMVQITHISEAYTKHNVLGNDVTINGGSYYFHPASLAAKNARIKQATAENEFGLIHEITNEWIDLRQAYACTVNKAQGSTFDRVFIDLDDISRCTSGDLLARMLYVAVSRARFQVFLTGDIN